MLAVLPAESTVIVRIARVGCAGGNTGPGVILAIGVDLDWAQLRAESSGGVSPVSIITYIYAGLVDQAAEAPMRAGVGTYVQDHISVDILYFGALCHALPSGVVSE